MSRGNEKHMFGSNQTLHVKTREMTTVLIGLGLWRFKKRGINDRKIQNSQSIFNYSQKSQVGSNEGDWVPPGNSLGKMKNL